MTIQTISGYETLVPLARHISTSPIGDVTASKAVYRGSFTPKQMLALANANRLGCHFIEGVHYASVPPQRRIHIWEQSYGDEQGKVFCGCLQSFQQTATEAETIAYNTYNSLFK